MNNSFDIYTIIFLIVAVVIILRLRSVLGRKTGNERTPIDRPVRGNEPASSPRERDNVIPLPRAEVPGATASGLPAESVSPEDRIRGSQPAESPATDGLVEIAKSDPGFDPKQFLDGAKAAYEMIVVAFAEGNRPTLKRLLSRDVFEGFATAITEREERGEKVATSFVGISRTDIVDAEVKNKAARVTVKFVSQLITAIKNKAGEVIDGDPTQIRDVTDIWTFARDVGSKDPNWRLVATQAAN